MASGAHADGRKGKVFWILASVVHDFLKAVQPFLLIRHQQVRQPCALADGFKVGQCVVVEFLVDVRIDDQGAVADRTNVYPSGAALAT